MKAEVRLRPVDQVALQADRDTAKCQVAPRNFRRRNEQHLEAFRSGGKGWRKHAPSIKQMNLIDVGNVDHGEWGVHHHIGSRFFQGFPDGGLSGCFAVFHKTAGQSPVAMARLDGAPAKQDIPFPFGNATDDESRIFVVDMTACLADVPRQRVTSGNG